MQGSHGLVMALFVGLGMVMHAGPVWSDVYKCPDGKGGARYQNSPCIEREDEPMILTGPRAAPVSPPPLAPLPSLDQEEKERNTRKLEVKHALVAFFKLEVRWWEAFQLAGSTARIALAGPVAQLQSIKQDMADLPVPMCLARPKGVMLAGMGAMIQGYLGFMRSTYFNPGKLFILGRDYFEQARIDAGICGN